MVWIVRPFQRETVLELRQGMPTSLIALAQETRVLSQFIRDWQVTTMGSPSMDKNTCDSVHRPLRTYVQWKLVNIVME